jgi:hypothetical protein
VVVRIDPQTDRAVDPTPPDMGLPGTLAALLGVGNRQKAVGVAG